MTADPTPPTEGSQYINTAARNAARRLSRLLDPPDPDPKAAP